MSKKKKTNKSNIDYKTLLLSATLDLIVGIILLILDKMF